MVRWLVAESDWGTLSTISRHLHGAPFGYELLIRQLSRFPGLKAWVRTLKAFTVCRNLVSLSDGPRGGSTGRLLFYLTDLDASAADLEVCHATDHCPTTYWAWP